MCLIDSLIVIPALDALTIVIESIKITKISSNVYFASQFNLLVRLLLVSLILLSFFCSSTQFVKIIMKFLSLNL